MLVKKIERDMKNKRLSKLNGCVNRKYHKETSPVRQ
jgi:hypothetical protein